MWIFKCVGKLLKNYFFICIKMLGYMFQSRLSADAIGLGVDLRVSVLL
jgi:hypothetical protein